MSVSERWRAKFRGPFGESAAVAVGLILTYLLFGTAYSLAVGAFNDDAVYVILGKALAAGEGYRSIHFVGSPVQLKYPPGLPAILAILWWIGGSLPNVLWMAMTLNIVVTGAAAGVVWWIGRVQLDAPRGVVLLLAISPFLLDASIQYFGLVLTEPYFVLGWAVSLALFGHLTAANGAPDRARLAVALGLTLAATTLIRTQAVLLIPAVLLALLMKRAVRRDVALCTLCSIVPLVAWWLYREHLSAVGPAPTEPDAGPYIAWIPWDDPGRWPGFIRSTLTSNGLSYWKILADYLNGARGIGYLMLGGLLALALVGGWRLRRLQPALVLTTLVTAMVIALWPFAQDRLALTCLPFIGLLAARGVDWRFAERSRRLRWVSGSLLALIAGSIALRQVELRRTSLEWLRGGPSPGSFSPSFVLPANSSFILGVSRWIAANTRRGDRIMVDGPGGVYLYTGRRGVSASPAESSFGPSVFDRPGHYLATRILEDSVSIVVLANVQSGIARDIGAFYERCPGVLAFQHRAGGELQGLPAYYRVTRQHDACIRQEILGRTSNSRPSGEVDRGDPGP